MIPRAIPAAAVCAAILAASGCAGSRPAPGGERSFAPPPPGAIVLFDGADASRWRHADGAPCRWPLKDGALVSKGGDLLTRWTFQDFLLHVEFRTPAHDETVTGQARGNSGVYLQSRYEVQILDSHGRPAGERDGGALYGQRAPDVNASRPPGAWQAYDIEFVAARFDDRGNKTAGARITVVHNGVTIHEDVELTGKTGAGAEEGPAPGPIRLQDHGNLVEFRNVWIVPALAADAAALEPAAFTPLLDRAHTDGWVQAGPGGFSVEDGIATPHGGMGLWYHGGRTYRDFVLRVEFQQKDVKSNSGVFVRFPRVDGDPWIPVREGYEIQIAGDEPAKNATASIYSFQAPSHVPLKRAGEWNLLEIACRAQRYLVRLNGEPVNLFDGSRSLEGYVGVQNHDGDGSGLNVVRYRNIRIAELPER